MPRYATLQNTTRLCSFPHNSQMSTTWDQPYFHFPPPPPPQPKTDLSRSFENSLQTPGLNRERIRSTTLIGGPTGRIRLNCPYAGIAHVRTESTLVVVDICGESWPTLSTALRATTLAEAGVGAVFADQDLAAGSLMSAKQVLEKGEGRGHTSPEGRSYHDSNSRPMSPADRYLRVAGHLSIGPVRLHV